MTPEYVRSLNDKPGILALAMKRVEVNGHETLVGEPFVVPGGRFNELYGWDSYMMAIGLIENKKIDLAMSMVKNFIFCIQHYGKIFKCQSLVLSVPVTATVLDGHGTQNLRRD